MLSRIEMDDILSRISYKQGWTFTLGIYDYIYERMFLHIQSNVVPDTHDSSKKVNLQMQQLVRTDSEDSFVWSVWQAIKETELHEQMEWFRYNNVIVDNPHLIKTLVPSQIPKPEPTRKYPMIDIKLTNNTINFLDSSNYA